MMAGQGIAAMKRIVALLIGALFFASPSRAEAPCDFKGISVGNKMASAEIMAVLGVAKYNINPARPSFEKTLALAQKYGTIPAAELEEWDIGPYCDETSCRVPYGVIVGNNNTPVNVFISFHEGLITEIEVSFSKTNWDEMLSIWDEKYGADWKIGHSYTSIVNYETKKTAVLELIAMTHITNGMNQSTGDHCQISAQNLDLVFEHHDAYGPYHSMFVIKLVSKKF
jgi:hypothetical protein